MVSRGQSFPPFAVTVDLVVLTIREGALRALLVRRGEEPFEKRWSLPGGFVAPSEDLPAAAQRVLQAKTALDLQTVHLEQIATYGAPKRDPRMRTVSVAYLAFLHDLDDPSPGPRELDAAWVPIGAAERRRLAFDHRAILRDGLTRARAKIEYTTLATRFCPPAFTLRQLRAVYEAVWDRELDAGNFARKVLAIPGFVEETGESVASPRGRPAKTYHAGDAWHVHPPLRAVA
ncbi:MAG: NUDIX domain-containing protein [Myxococcota bacterium]